MFENRIDLDELQKTVQEIKYQISQTIVGQERMIELLIIAILADGHVLLEGMPGVAKTLTAKLIAKVISADFSRIQFTPDLMPSDVLGTSIYNVKVGEFEYKKGPIFSNIILIDEINRSPAKTQAALFEVMEERQITMDGHTYQMSPPFMVLATQNPVEQEGTYRLPEAQLDRFLFKILVNYPSLDEETILLDKAQTLKGQFNVINITPILTAELIERIRQKVKEVHIEAELIKYIAQIVHTTRQHNALYLGASPRASLAILNSSKAFAAMQGRDFVTPEDVQAMVFPVLRHRVLLTPEKEMEGTSVDMVIKQIVQGIEVPR
jgi:MoxR-like ATPase